MLTVEEAASTDINTLLIEDLIVPGLPASPDKLCYFATARGMRALRSRLAAATLLPCWILN